MNKLLIVLLFGLPGAAALAQMAPIPPKAGGLAPGLHVFVVDGAIMMSNKGGVQQLAPGQFGFAGGQSQPPTMVPKNPGIQFMPPPAFNTTTASNTASTSKPASAVDCEVR